MVRQVDKDAYHKIKCLFMLFGIMVKQIAFHEIQSKTKQFLI